MTDDEPKRCFFDKERPCDLTCKAAFEVDDPVDNVDCYFIWLAHHMGESLFDLKRFVENATGVSTGEGPGPGSGPPGFPGFPGPKGPKGFPNN